MLNKKIVLAAFGSIVLMGSAYSMATNTLDMTDVVAREASEGPRGGDNERPGDRQRRGGRLNAEDVGQFILAREASEGPRGKDNERPGDRQRRGGRNA